MGSSSKEELVVREAAAGTALKTVFGSKSLWRSLGRANVPTGIFRGSYWGKIHYEEVKSTLMCNLPMLNGFSNKMLLLPSRGDGYFSPNSYSSVNYN